MVYPSVPFVVMSLIIFYWQRNVIFELRFDAIIVPRKNAEGEEGLEERKRCILDSCAFY